MIAATIIILIIAVLSPLFLCEPDVCPWCFCTDYEGGHPCPNCGYPDQPQASRE